MKKFKEYVWSKTKSITPEVIYIVGVLILAIVARLTSKTSILSGGLVLLGYIITLSLLFDLEYHVTLKAEALLSTNKKKSNRAKIQAVQTLVLGIIIAVVFVSKSKEFHELIVFISCVGLYAGLAAIHTIRNIVTMLKEINEKIATDEREDS